MAPPRKEYKMCSCDFDGPSCIREEIRTARKRYKCCECFEPIEPGDKYEYVRGLWEGWDTFRTCDCCVDQRKYMLEVDHSVCLEYGNLKEQWEYFYGG